MENGESVSADDVLCKLKDDGDFDRLRLKIIRQLKENEELRNSIIATVKQSATLTCPGAENMKPRQLSDAIHAEVGDKLMSQISDSLWGIIRSPDGMKKEIVETVESVYNKLSNPLSNKNGASPLINDLALVQYQNENLKNQTETPNEVGYLSDGEPPGFSSSSLNVNNQLKQPKEEQGWDLANCTVFTKEQSQEPRQSKNVAKLDTEEMGPPGFSTMGNFKQPIDVSDDDPVVPPGFG